MWINFLCEQYCPASKNFVAHTGDKGISADQQHLTMSGTFYAV